MAYQISFTIDAKSALNQIAAVFPFYDYNIQRGSFQDTLTFFFSDLADTVGRLSGSRNVKSSS